MVGAACVVEVAETMAFPTPTGTASILVRTEGTVQPCQSWLPTELQRDVNMHTHIDHTHTVFKLKRKLIKNPLNA